MVKVKNKNKVSADKVQKKRQSQFSPKPINPFEVHLNKEKIKVVGRKQKNDKGLPGVSRAKAIKKRKHTLLREYKVLNKSNIFNDRRIGERNHGIPESEKATMRYAATRMKAHKKKNIFNLTDDDITHKGHTLSAIEKFDDPRSDEDLDENEKGDLDSNFVKDAHFGGDIFNKGSSDGATTHKQLIDKLIEESKKRKAEKLKTKEATLELTEKLDTEWKDLLQIVSANKQSKEEQPKKQIDDYDKMLKELKFEARGTVSDRLKKPEELLEEENKKHDILEKERIQRMNANEEENKKPTYRSADDLDDDFIYESVSENNMLSYNEEGQSNIEVNAEIGEKNSINDVDEDEETSSNRDETASSSDSDDSLNDLKQDETDSEVEDNEDNNKITDSTSEKVTTVESNDFEPDSKLEDSIVNDGIPTTLPLASSYEDLKETLQNWPVTLQSKVLAVMINSNKPDQSQGNKEQLGLLLHFILQYLNGCFSESKDLESLKNSFYLLKSFMPYIFDLAQLSQLNIHKLFVEIIKEKHTGYRKNRSTYPGLEILMHLKLVCLLFTTSDFRHQVVTPSFMFMEQMLTNCKIRNKRDIPYGLFLCMLVSEYTSLSNRYMPATLNFLAGLLHMSIPKNKLQLLKAPHPFKPLCSYLVLTRDCSKSKPKIKLDIETLLKSDMNKINNEFRINILYPTLRLLKDFHDQYRKLPSSVEMFSSIQNFLERIPIELYPKEVQLQHEELLNGLKLGANNKKLMYIVLSENKPKALRLYEPKIEAIYDTKRRKIQSKEKAEREKLLYKLKKERKGALREIRRDKAFLGRVKVKQRVQSDLERKEKVKKIYMEAATQQSELKALDRKKKK